jgi:hypothetical protein
MMSQTRLRILESRFFTLEEGTTLLKVSKGRLWNWRQGADVLTDEQLKKLEAAVLERIYRLTSLAVA